MLEGDAARIQHLRNTNREFAALERRHRALDEALRELTSRRGLTPDEAMHRKTLQKQKLAAKDRLYVLLRRTTPPAPAAGSAHVNGRPHPLPLPPVARSRWMDAFMSSHDDPAAHD